MLKNSNNQYQIKIDTLYEHIEPIVAENEILHGI